MARVVASAPLTEEALTQISVLIRQEIETIRQNDQKELDLVTRIVRLDEGQSAILKQMDKRFELMKESMDKRFEQVDKRFEQVDKRFEQVDKRLELMKEYMDKRFEQVDKRLELMKESMDKRFEQVDKRFELLDKRLDKFDDRFNRLERKFFQFMIWSFGFTSVVAGVIISVIKLL